LPFYDLKVSKLDGLGFWFFTIVKRNKEQAFPIPEKMHQRCQWCQRHAPHWRGRSYTSFWYLAI